MHVTTLEFTCQQHFLFDPDTTQTTDENKYALTWHFFTFPLGLRLAQGLKVTIIT